MSAYVITWLVLAAGAADAAPVAKPAVDVRVGLLAYEDFRKDLQYYETLFAELAAASNTPVAFRLTAGTYADIMHWLDHDRLDVAIVTPGILAAGLTTGDHGRAHGGYEYLATKCLPPASSALALPDRRKPGRHDRYRSVCVVAAASPIRTSDELQQAARQGRVEFLFVDPLSVSGRIAPEYALRQLGIRAARDEITYTYSHSQTLRQVAEATGPVTCVGFVWDDALQAAPQAADGVRRVPWPALEELWIPADAVMARDGFAQAELVRSLLTRLRPEEFRCLPDAIQRYRPVRQWSTALELPAELPDGQHVSLEDLGAMLLHDARSQRRPPRLAVVFSGGGAKCSYQVGAVAALEEKLAELRREDSAAGLDIALVVGTSGGAINAVPVALGLTADEAGRAAFAEAWKHLDQRDIVRPPRLARTNIGVWFALVQIALVVWWSRRREATDRRRRMRVRWRTLIGLGAAEIAVGYLPWSPWATLGSNHLLHHAWLWCTFGIHWSAWCLLAVGLAGIALDRVPADYRQRWAWTGRWVKRAFWVGVLGLPLVQILSVLFYEETLSEGTGITNVLAREFTELIDGHLARQRLAPLALGQPRSDRERFQAVSRQIIERGLLKRDLVLTGSCLAQSSPALPPDLYFYAAADPRQPPPPLGARGIALVDRPGLLLDVVMGSGSIYPLFPPRRLQDFPRDGQYVDLVDGGFAHNSPIEAAVLWGATHLVLIQASPEQRNERRNFLENATAAFQHLYDQAQRMDVQSKEQVTVFTLKPQAPHVCVLDFANNLIEQAIAKGYREARGKNAAGQPGAPTFRKELGTPIFWTPGP